jgi:hypothetical protein
MLYLTNHPKPSGPTSDKFHKKMQALFGKQRTKKTANPMIMRLHRRAGNHFEGIRVSTESTRSLLGSFDDGCKKKPPHPRHLQDRQAQKLQGSHFAGAKR